jgi:predicted transport protein
MSDLKLFRVATGGVEEIPSSSVLLEKSLQSLIEKHLEAFLGVRFLATEYSTGAKHGGRIDTLGIDENGCPVIIEYKRALNENVMNQGLYYLDWLLDHRAEFELIVLKQYGNDTFKAVEWTAPRLLCIAGEFTKYDEHAVQQINRNIELIRYRRYGDDLLLFELVNATTATPVVEPKDRSKTPPLEKKVKPTYKTVTDYIQQASPELRDRFEALRAWAKALGDDVQENTLNYYVAFKRLKNFCCVEVHPRGGVLVLFVKVDPSTIRLEEGFTRDVREIGHFGTGDLEIAIRNDADLEKAKPLILKSYEVS